jgi:hypothetical protein
MTLVISEIPPVCPTGKGLTALGKGGKEAGSEIDFCMLDGDSIDLKSLSECRQRASIHY